MPANHPYHSATNAYTNMSSVGDQRSLEGRILIKAALRLDLLAQRLSAGEQVTREEIGETMEYNQKLWTIFVAETMNQDHPLPQEIKNNIASLGVFVFKRTMDILADTQPEKIRALVDINRNIASGLMKASANAAAAAPATPPDAATHTPTDNTA